MQGDTIIYDIETQESFQDIGTRDPKRLHISLIGMYSYKENAYFSYTEDELSQFWRRVEQCNLIIGFNNHGFDDIVCSVYFPEMDKVPSFDMLAEVHRNLGFRVKLDNLAHATLGTGKSGDGLKAIRLYREGKIEELREYCLDDVRITKELFEIGKARGQLKYSDMQGTKEVQVNFFPKIEKPQPLNLSLF